MAISSKAKDQLVSLLGSERFLDTPEARESASSDETHGLVPVLPDAVVFPMGHDEVERVVQIARAFKIPLTPRGAGTGKSGGCVPAQGGLVMDMSRMNKILDLNDTDFTAVVEPGVILADLKAAAEALQLYYPPDPISAPWCTLGGNFAENASGPSCVRYGTTRDYVLGVRAVLGTGESAFFGKKTVKGVAGYDLVSLLCASEGTLAIVTELHLRLLPKARAFSTALLLFESNEAALVGVTQILKAGVLPVALEFMDAKCVALLRQEEPELLALAQSALLVEIEALGEQAALHDLHVALEASKPSSSVVAMDAAKRRALWALRSQLSQATKCAARFKVSEDIVVPRSKMVDMLNFVDDLGVELGFGTCAFGHAGDGNLHVQILFDDASMGARVPDFLEKLFTKTLSLGGSITGEHGVGLAKKDFVEAQLGKSVVHLQKQIKAIFDPDMILNPGKIED